MRFLMSSLKSGYLFLVAFVMLNTVVKHSTSLADEALSEADAIKRIIELHGDYEYLQFLPPNDKVKDTGTLCFGPCWKGGNDEIKLAKCIHGLKSVSFGYSLAQSIALIKDPVKERENDKKLPVVSDEGVRVLYDIPSIEDLDLRQTGTTDAGLTGISNLSHLTKLNLLGTKVTNAGMIEIAAISSLVDLDLTSAKIDGQGIERLLALKKLRLLNVEYTSLGDADVPILEKFKSLQYMDIVGTRITADGYARLKAALPKCRVYWLSKHVQR